MKPISGAVPTGLISSHWRHLVANNCANNCANNYRHAFTFKLNHKEVAMDNFALHESHCRRFLSVCPECDETVPREHLEQHRLDEHTQLQECVARLLSCEFCQLELPCSELQQHEWACGSRTDRCSVCHRYILLRDLDQHTSTCSTAAAVGPRPPQTTDMAPVKSEAGLCPRLEEDLTRGGGGGGGGGGEEEEEGASARKVPQEEEEEEEEEEGASALKMPQEEEEEEEEEEEGVSALKLSRGKGDPDWVLPCSYCQLVLPQVTLRWHEVTRTPHKFNLAQIRVWYLCT
ncbi:hypothetical protein CRUP_009478 [Coryphaenoides rupestris]|nr:hypothetical protein CRUP_009478 [Coryphaenoides rupestris]